MPINRDEALTISYVPEQWRNRLLHQDWAVVLPGGDAAEFGRMIDGSRQVARSDGRRDVLGMRREGVFPVWITGIIEEDGECAGVINFGGRSRAREDVPKIGFWMPTEKRFGDELLNAMCDALEVQFGRAYGVNQIHEVVEQWEPLLRPTNAVINALGEGKRPVVFMGKSPYFGYLRYLGVKDLPNFLKGAENLVGEGMEIFGWEIGAGGGIKWREDIDRRKLPINNI